MAEKGRADWPTGESDEIGSKRRQRGGQRILVGEIELAEDQSGCGAVKKKVVPLDCCSDGAGDHGMPELSTMFVLGDARERHFDVSHVVPQFCEPSLHVRSGYYQQSVRRNRLPVTR